MNTSSSSRYSLTPVQHKMWILDRMGVNPSVYNLPSAYTITGYLDVNGLERTIQQIITKHGALRTVFEEFEGEVKQRVLPEIAWTIEHLPCTENAEKYIIENQKWQFNLTNGPLLRVAVAPYCDENNSKWLLLFNIHHIISDATSLSQLISEICNDYGKDFQKQDIRSITYKTQNNSFGIFADMHAKWMQSDEFKHELDWWIRFLQSSTTPFDMPTDKPRPLQQNFAGASIRKKIDAETVDVLYDVADSCSVSIFALLLALINVVLYKQSGSTEIIIGSPVQGRNITTQNVHKPVYVEDDVIGCFINVIPLLSRINPQHTLGTFIKNVGNSTQNALKHQSVPLEAIIQNLGLERDMSRAPLFDCLFTYISHIETEPKMEGLNMEYIDNSNDLSFSRYDLVFQIVDSPELFSIDFNYNTDLFNQERIECIAEQFIKLCENVAMATDISLANISVMGQQERKMLEKFSQGEQIKYSELSPLPVWIREKAKECGDAVALVYPDENDMPKQISWSALSFLMDNVAQQLLAHGVQHGDFVAVIGGRNFESTLSLPAVLATGAIFVPIDKDLPVKRIEYMLSTVNPKCILVDGDTFDFEPYSQLSLTDLSIAKNLECFLSNQQNVLLQYKLTMPEINMSDTAILLFTSGSTGEPRASFTTHKALLNTVMAFVNTLNIEQGQAVLQFAGFSFDAAILNVLNAWYAKGAVVLLGKEIINDVHRFSTWIKIASVDSAIIPPAYLRLLGRESCISSLFSLKSLVSAGEPAPLMELSPCILAGVNVFNGYGPSETAVCASMYQMIGTETNNVPIGKPIANTFVHIISSEGKLLPYGMEGEIWIGGLGVSKGYLCAEHTSERFVHHPQYDWMYRSGDRGKWDHEGNLLFLGRVDEQIKIAGNRIEPAEVMNAIRSLPGIIDAIVLPWTNEKEDKCLAAWYISKESRQINPDDLRNQLMDILPSYAVPHFITPTLLISLTVNGKIAVKELPRPCSPCRLKNALQLAPQNEKEQILLDIWSHLLGKESIACTDNLFAFGADSITAIRAISRLSHKGWKCSVKDIFKHATIQSIAQVLKPVQTLAILPSLENIALGPIQKYFFEMGGSCEKFSQTVLLRNPMPFSCEDAKNKITFLWQKHDMLRAEFTQIPHKQKWIQSIKSTTDNVPEFYTQLPEEMPQEMMDRLQNEISLSKNKLFCCGFHAEGYLIIAIHHMIVDVISWRILVDDLNILENTNTICGVPDKTISENQFGHWNTQLQQSDIFDSETTYWQNACLATHNSPYHSSSDVLRFRKSYTVQSFKLSHNQTALLLESGMKAYGANMEDFLLTVLIHAEVYAKPAPVAHNKVQVTLEYHGREDFFDINLSHAVGWFTSIFPVVLEKQTHIGETFFAVKDALRNVPHKGLGYGVLKYLRGKNIPFLSSHFEFNYLGQIHSATNLEHGQFRFQQIASHTSEDQAMGASLCITCLIYEDGCLECTLSMDANEFSAIEQKNLCQKFQQGIDELLSHCLSLKEPVKTAADYGDPSISQSSLEKTVEEYGKIDSIRPLNIMELRTYYDLVMYPHLAPTYIKQAHYRLQNIDIEDFSRRLTRAYQRHENLRMVCPIIDNVPRAVILSDRKPSLSIKDLRHLSSDEQLRSIKKEKENHKNNIIDIAHDELLHVGLYHVSDQFFDLTITFNHILFDRWGAEILFAEISRNDVESVSFDMRNYAEWLTRQNAPSHLAWWNKELANIEIPTYIQGVNRKYIYKQGTPYLQEVQNFSLSAEVLERCKKISELNHISLSTLYKSAFATVLQIYSGSDDIVFHSIHSARPTELIGIKNTIGFFTNVIPCRFSLPSTMTFTERLLHFQEHALECEKHIWVASSDIYAQTPFKSSISDALFIMENLPVMHEHSNAIETIDAVNMTGSPLTLTVEGVKDFNFNYCADIIDATTIKSFAEMLLKFLDIVSQYPDTALNHI